MSSRRLRTLLVVASLAGIAADGELRCDPSLSCSVREAPPMPTDAAAPEEPPCAVTEGCGIDEVALGQNHSCARSNDGRVFCWGDHSQGQVGDGIDSGGATLRRHAPAPVAGIQDARSIATGAFHSCALRRSGAVYCWGFNDDRQVWGAEPRAPRPVRVAIEVPATDVAAGGAFSCAAIPDGVWCWGTRQGFLAEGLLATGSVVEVDAGPTMLCWLLSNGTLGCEDGRSRTGVVDFGVGAGFLCTLADDGYVYCVGENDSGQLGDGTTDTRVVEVRVDVPGTPVAVSTGGVIASMRLEMSTLTFFLGHTCAVNDAGELYCWGENGSGQIGDGTTWDRHVPVRIDLDGVVDVDLGGSHSCAILEGGQIRCWGAGSFGQLGNAMEGSSADRSTPGRVFGLP